jgi:hypothetical protein
MVRRLRSTLLVSVVLTVALAAFSTVLSSTAQACPGCKEAINEQSQQIARGYSYSILFMMPIPFIILGSFGGYVYYTIRKRDAESQTKTPTVASTSREETPVESR